MPPWLGRTAAWIALLCCCGATRPYTKSGEPPAPPADLPQAVFFKTDTESFTHEWDVALRGGRIWIRPNREAGAAWRLLPPDGYAHHRLRDTDDSPPILRRITADGDNLAALGDDGLVYYMKFSDWGWINHWGLPPFGAPLWAHERLGSLSISHRGPLAQRYDDIDGNAHPIDVGVTTLYALSPDHRFVVYADPWLRHHFNRRICLPRRGRYRAEALSASASTLLVIDASGAAFTRLADYDSLGDNPVLKYTYRRGGGSQNIRVLPPEDWAAQPRLPGRVTSRITIFQTGPGNAGRTLRVEGLGQRGEGGFYEKTMGESAWRFVTTGAQVSPPFLDPPPAEPPRAQQFWRGSLERPAIDDPPQIELVDFDPDCPPATVRFTRRGQGAEVPFHWRRSERDGDGEVVTAQGALLVPPPPPELADAFAALFGSDQVVEMDLEVGEDVTLSGDAPGLFKRLRLRFSAP